MAGEENNVRFSLPHTSWAKALCSHGLVETQKMSLNYGNALNVSSVAALACLIAGLKHDMCSHGLVKTQIKMALNYMATRTEDRQLPDLVT